MRIRARWAVPATVVTCALTAALLSAPAGADDADAVVLTPVSAQSGPAQDPNQVAARVDKLATSKGMGKAAGTVILDAETGDVLYDDESGTALIPASTNKIATALAAVHLIGPETRITTKTTKDPNSSTVFIVGGGDPLLASHQPPEIPGVVPYPPVTPLKQLARQTADQLKAQNTGDIDLKVDDTLFSGPDWGDWPATDRTSGNVSPVTALLVDKGRVGGQWGPKVPDPGMAGGQIFADLLKQDGVTVKSVQRAKSPDGATDLASIQSAPVAEVVGEMLSLSQNDTAEDLFRLSGVAAGFGGSFDGGSQAVSKALDDLGISAMSAQFHDGSGLSKSDRMPPRLLADILRRVVTGEDGLWPIGAGLSVAGVSGTLRYRFLMPETKVGAGWVHGKTGTLTSVSGLAGYMQSESGRMLVFATISNEAPSSGDASHILDQIVAQATSCGCPTIAR